MNILRKCVSLEKSPIQLQFIRWKGNRVNVQRPRKPQYEKARLLELTKPIYPEPLEVKLPPSLKCKIKEETPDTENIVTHPLERIIGKEVLNWFNHSKLVGFYHINPINGEDQFNAKVLFYRENMHLKIREYSKRVLRIGLENTPYACVLQLMKTHNSILFSEEPKVDRLLKITKKIPQLVLLAAIVDDHLLSVSQLKNYANMGDISNVRAQLVSTINSIGGTVVNQLNCHQQILVSQLEQIRQIKENT